MRTDANFLMPLVEGVLRNHEAHSWSLQGFGMLRTYLGPKSDPKRFRLNLWDSRFAVPGVSTIHDHPWHFDSVIVAGCFCNVRYRMAAKLYDTTHTSRCTHNYIEIKCGPDGGMDNNQQPGSCILVAGRPELYVGGDTYHQEATEIHESIPYDGTVTFNERQTVGDGEHARVFYPINEKWIDAKPRDATNAEVGEACRDSLLRWFK